MRIDSFSWFSINPKNSHCFLQSMFSFFKYSIWRRSQCGMPHARFEQFLKLDSIENFWQYLNLRPRTNPMKAITKSPSNDSHKVTRYLVRLRQCNPNETLQVFLHRKYRCLYGYQWDNKITVYKVFIKMQKMKKICGSS